MFKLTIYEDGEVIVITRKDTRAELERIAANFVEASKEAGDGEITYKIEEL